MHQVAIQHWWLLRKHLWRRTDHIYQNTVVSEAQRDSVLNSNTLWQRAATSASHFALYSWWDSGPQCIHTFHYITRPCWQAWVFTCVCKQAPLVLVCHWIAAGLLAVFAVRCHVCPADSSLTQMPWMPFLSLRPQCCRPMRGLSVARSHH